MAAAEPMVESMDEQRITAISLSRGPCYSPCPVYRVTLSRAGDSVYIGRDFVEHVGPHHGRLDPKRFDRLVRSILHKGFEELHPFYESEGTCGSLVSLVLWSERPRWHVDDFGTAPPAFGSMTRLVDNAVKTVDWQPGSGPGPSIDDVWSEWQEEQQRIREETPIHPWDLDPDASLPPAPLPPVPPVAERVRTRAWGIPPDRYGSQHLEASLLSTGDLVIEGQDLGQDLPIHGLIGVTEYEYAWSIPASDIDSLFAALGGQPGDDILTLLLDRFPEQPGGKLNSFFEEHGITAPFWSRFTD